jgi:6,7-dimethyl-8-ribityllumazine synthase
MATELKNLSSYDPASVPSGKGRRIAIVVAEWNSDITFAMRDAAIKTLLANGVAKSAIEVTHVPGTFELTLGAQLAGQRKSIDAVICIGCVIQGDTRHFDFICQGVTYGITELNISLEKPVVFGVLTTKNLQQARDRSGGKHGNKGDEAAVTALKMIAVKNSLKR